jgi:hypothetical protein
VEGLDTILAPFQLCFSMTSAPAVSQGAVIFSATKLSAQLCCPALAESKERRDACDHDDGDGDNQDDLYGT